MGGAASTGGGAGTGLGGGVGGGATTRPLVCVGWETMRDCKTVDFKFY